ncbi:MAG: TatD family hydrolase [Xanthomonadales bacterium]|nr:TatD family hydrolase [Xanthomonadales bacterium]
MPLIDSHCHLDAPEFDADRDAVLAQARAAGVVAQVIPAVTAASWRGLRALCAREPDLFPAYGLHPMFLAEHRREHLDLLHQWVQRERPVAVGEFGLDFFVESLEPAEQHHYFEAQLAIAAEAGLPVILHARRAVEATLIALRRYRGHLRGVVHSYAGSSEQARQLFELGFSLGVGGPVTYPRAQRLRDLVARMPIEFLLLESDAPDQPLMPYRGQRNLPSRVVEVAACIASLRGASVEEVAEQSSANARSLFALPH